jgi:hypothetical protein
MSTYARRVLALALAVAAGLSITAGVLPAQAATTTLRIYVSPTGDDAGTGASADRPVRSLQRAHELVRWTRAGRPVEVLLAGGTYRAAPMVWSQYASTPTVIRASGVGGRPVINGSGADGFALAIRPAVPGATMNLTISGISFARWENGIQVSKASGVTLDDITWYKIGGRWATSKRTGYAALHLSDGDGVTVRNSRFQYVENATAQDANLIHAIYATLDSDGLTVTSSSFTFVSGDAIRVRNGSDGVTVAASTFRAAGFNAAVSDWYRASAGEIPSVGGRITASTVMTNYSGRSLRRTYCFDTKTACPVERITAG